MISVIIPALNESSNLKKLLPILIREDVVGQIIVVDGGSEDDTQKIARKHDVDFYESKMGRARQMNFGAKKAKHEVLLFLHADSNVSQADFAQIPRVLKTYDAGSFYLSFDYKNRLLGFYSTMSKLNFSVFTYGDQGLFIKRTVFEKLNGFREIPIMEDIDMVRRIKRRGSFVKLNTPIISSSRRFVKNGVLRQQFLNVALVSLYYIGVNTKYLARFYHYK
ncbi:glycosyltransferase [Fulvivirga sp. RKSG066]|uniref:TIGR04283 family arsenosugar biosynthesis glycosyltransferase n=1 Tax=Fulvivirga aurantia TaxID=2529383 RepID=UPI0012BBC966|nr:TIGR04283 family arsenosugar biosynthesis glycosyltransferase [Fulvivirga aurantia]MTI22754.1 glycosyltransferase [Fulvivirga aurantia]